jgi:hypothetical protein
MRVLYVFQISCSPLIYPSTPLLPCTSYKRILIRADNSLYTKDRPKYLSSLSTIHSRKEAGVLEEGIKKE